MDADKLAKVLALAESEHQGEALSALRAARIILARSGMTFRDLAVAVQTPSPREVPPQPQRPNPPMWNPPDEAVVQGLRRQVGELERENDSLRRKLDRMQTDVEHQREETEHWRVLARETAEKLWDLGKALERRHSRSDKAAVRRSIIEYLQDPASGLLSDHEIARRIGTAPQLVAECRRRLAIVGRRLRLLPVQPRGRGLWSGLDLRTLDKPRRKWSGLFAVVTISGHAGQVAKR
jgi:hypothetical protein